MSRDRAAKVPTPAQLPLSAPSTTENGSAGTRASAGTGVAFGCPPAAHHQPRAPDPDPAATRAGSVRRRQPRRGGV